MLDKVLNRAMISAQMISEMCEEVSTNRPSLHGFAKIVSKKYPSFSALTFAVNIQKIFLIIFQKQNLECKSDFSKQLGNS